EQSATAEVRGAPRQGRDHRRGVRAMESRNRAKGTAGARDTELPSQQTAHEKAESDGEEVSHWKAASRRRASGQTEGCPEAASDRTFTKEEIGPRAHIALKRQTGERNGSSPSGSARCREGCV